MTITIEPIQITQDIKKEQLIQPAELLENLQYEQKNEDILEYIKNNLELGDEEDIIPFESIYEDISELFRILNKQSITREELHQHLQEMDVLYCIGLYMGARVKGTNVYAGLKWK